MKRPTKWAGLLLCAVLLWALLPTAAFARGLLSTAEPVSLTLRYPCAGAPFQIYRVAEVSVYGEYTLTGDFRDYPVTLEQPDQAGWRALAATLEAYAVRDGLTPAAAGETDRDGRLTFSSLEAGMYLVTGQRHTAGGYRYTPEPFLAALPGLDEEDNWVSDVTASPKYERKHKDTNTPGDGTVKRKVLKVWEDDGDESGRPQKVTVQLLRDGKVWDTVTLSEKNGWSYEWSKLDADYTWRVAEKDVPEDYTVTVSREGVTFVITNTLAADIPDEPTPEGPPPETPGGPDGTDGTDIPEEPAPEAPGDSLPQTGVLWWPVPLMACCGVGLFLIGWAKRRSGESDEG